MKRLKKKMELRQRMLNLYHSKLTDQRLRKHFCEEVIKDVNHTAEPTYSALSATIITVPPAYFLKGKNTTWLVYSEIYLFI